MSSPVKPKRPAPSKAQVAEGYVKKSISKETGRATYRLATTKISKKTGRNISAWEITTKSVYEDFHGKKPKSAAVRKPRISLSVQKGTPVAHTIEGIKTFFKSHGYSISTGAITYVRSMMYISDHKDLEKLLARVKESGHPQDVTISVRHIAGGHKPAIAGPKKKAAKKYKGPVRVVYVKSKKTKKTKKVKKD